METRSLHSKQIAVSCVLWQGEFRNREYNLEWVQKLKKMVSRNLSFDFDFVCFNNIYESDCFDEDNQIFFVPLKNKYPGWWAKIEQFSSNFLEDYNFVLSLDLDLFIIKNIDILFEFSKDCDMCFAPQTELLNMKVNKQGKRVVQKVRSGVFIYKPCQCAFIADSFNRNPEKYIQEFRGDQDFIGSLKNEIDVFPRFWFEKTKAISKRTAQKPKEDTIIVFGNHIKNDQASKKWKWANKIWNK